jgi:hypothetical protein
MKFVRRGSKTEHVAPAAPAAPRVKVAPRRVKGADSKGKGKQRFTLIIGDEGAILVYMQGATVVRRLFAISPQPDHTAAIMELMISMPHVPLYVLADVIDQQYVRHTFPPVSALSVNNLVKRRISRDFQAEDITGSLRLGREKTGRKEWQYLLIALANTALIQQWLELLVELPNELKGIYLSPVESQNYIAQLHQAMTKEKPLPWQLLVSHQKVSGFRQVVLQNGKLVFTRVTQAIDDAVPAVIAGNIEQEITNTLEYLRRLGFLENNTMEITVVTGQEVQEVLDVKRFKAGQSWVLTPLQVADALRLEQAALSADRFGDVVMAAAFARSRRHVLRLFTAYAQKLSQLYMARLGAKVVGGGIALLILASIASNLSDWWTARGEISAIEEKGRPLQSQLATVRKAIGGLNADVAFKSAIMLTHDAYLKNAPKLDGFVKDLAPHLVPQARVRTITWGDITNTTGGNRGGNMGSMGAPPGGPSMGMGGGMGAPGAPNAVQAVTTKVEFEFAGRYTDTEQLGKFVTEFLNGLKTKMPNYTITNDPFPWQNQTQSNVEINFDQQIDQPPVRAGDNRVVVTFTGPNPVGTQSAPGGAPMGVAPMPMGGM